MSLQCRQHGMVVRGPEARAERERLARGADICLKNRHAARPAWRAIRRMMRGPFDMFASAPPPTAPASAPAAPLSDDERALQSALRLVAASETVAWQSLRDLVGAGYVHVTTTHLLITD